MGSGVGSLIFGALMSPTFLYFSQDCHLGPSALKPCFSQALAETLRQSRQKLYPVPSGVLCPAQLSSVLAGAQPLAAPPSPHCPLVRALHRDSARQPASGPRSGRAASKAVFVLAPAQTKRNLSQQPRARWGGFCWLLLRRLLPLLS